MRSIFACWGLMLVFRAGTAPGQVNIYNDGPIALDIRVKRCWSNQNFDITGLQYLLFGPNEYTYKLRFRDLENLDGADWTAWKTVAADNQGYVWSPDDNQIVFSYTYSGTQAPNHFEFEYEAFRNRCGGRTDYNCCEIFGLCTGIYDANRRQGVGRVAFRAAEAGVWTVAQALSSDGQYAFQFEYRWRYTYPLPPLCPNPPYSDGPVALSVWLDRIWADTDFDGFGFFGAEELNVQFRFKDNLDAAFPPTYFCYTGSQSSPQFNLVNASVLNRTYADIAANSFQFDFRVWEDDCPCELDFFSPDCPQQCVYNTGSECNYLFGLINDPDDNLRTATGNIDFRSSPPGVDNYFDFPINVSTTERFTNWTARIRYRWTLGTPSASVDIPAPVCQNAPLTLSAITQNATYYQWQEGVGTSCDAITQWNDIPGAVCRDFAVPTNFAGTKFYRLVVANRAGPGSNTNLGDHIVYAHSNCVPVTRNGPGNIPVIAGPCGLTLPGNAVAGFSVPLMPGAASYTWTTTAPGAVVVNGQGTNAASVSFGAQGGEVRVTVDFGACGQATNSCFVTVDPTPTCDFIYVTPTAPDNGAGNSQNPVSLQGALNLYNPGDERNVIRMSAGAYTFNGILNMESGLQIEGGYSVVNGNWTKDPAAVTTVNFVNCLEEVPGGSGFDVGHHIGVKCNFVNNFGLQDLVLNIPSVTGQTQNRGRSVYGIYLNGASNYDITRVRVTVGNASAGADGVQGAAGAQGARGQDGGNGQNNSCGPGFGAGGAGGNNPSINGAQGGAGGSGRCAESGLSGSTGTSSGGVSGGGGGGGGNRPGCNIFNCQANSSHDGLPGGDATGTPPQAAAGTSGPAGSVAAFFLPGGQAGTGQKGTGGAGGGGGGGGGGQTGVGCSDDKGAGGGGGGQGGEGGNGGTGGWGGGSAFGLYAANNGVNGNVMDCQFVVGTPGAGGAGGPGGPGGQGGEGGNGGICVVSGNCQNLGAGSCGNQNASGSSCARGCDFGMGGRGGRGGRGGQGGNGGQGAAGTAAPTQFVNGNPLPITGTYPSSNPGITLSYTKGCTNSEVLLSETPPNASAWNLLSAATGGQFVPDVSNGISSYNVNSPNIAVYYPTTGYKDIQNGAFTLRKFVNIRTVRPLPVIAPIPDEICAGESIALSTSTTGTIYDWRVLQVSGAGTPGNPIEVFSSGTPSGNTVVLNAPGVYQVKLKVFENCCGWSIPVYKTVVVKRRPPAPQFLQFTSRVCQPSNNVVYQIQNVDGADSYQWTVPAALGSITSGQGTTQITVTWFGAGTGTVVARAIGVGCLSGDAILNVEVIAPPNVSLSAAPTAICEGNEVTFTAVGTGEIYRFTAQGGAVLQDWSGLSTYTTNELFFGQNPVVQAQAAIRADNDALCLSPLSNPVSINVSPIPSLTLTSSDPDLSICEGDFVTITANPQNVAGGTPRYIFYRNENPNDILGEPLQTQNFVITDQIRDGDVIYATVFNGPPTNCPSQPARLDAFSVQRPPVTGNATLVPSCGPAQTGVVLDVRNTTGSLIWQVATNLTFPNYVDIPGATDSIFVYTLPNVTGADTTIFYFRARYTVTGGCTNIPLASTDLLFYLSRPPVADSATVCENNQATFFVPAPCPTCLTQWYDSPGASIPIFTGNTFTTPLLTAPVTYYVAFRYPGGCVSSRTPFKVKLFDAVFPNAQNQERCGPGNVTLSVTLDPVNCPGCTYNWYDNAGNYLQSGATFNTGNISLTTTYRVEAVSVQGCTGPRQAVEAIVRSLPEVQALALQPAVCIGNSTVLQASGAASYQWIPAAGLSATDIPNPVANPVATTTYTVTGTAADGCQKTATVTVTVHPLPNISAFAVDNTLCVGENTATFTAGAVIYAWSPPDGVSNPSAPTPVLNPSVSTNYTVTGTDANGCTNTTTLFVEVLDLPTVTATADDAEICSGASTQLNAGGGVSYLWTPSAGLSAADIPNPVATPASTRTYTVTATDANGCKNTASVTVTVVVPPVLTAFAADDDLCIGENTTLNVAGGPDDVDYVWEPASAIDGPNVGLAVVARPQSTTTYTVSAVFGGECVSQATVPVVVRPLPNVQISAPTDVLCLGQSVNLFATGAAGYVWSPATGLNNPNVPNPIATPATTTSYTVTGTDANGCVNTREITITVNPLPVVSATATPPAICTGQQTAQLQASGATTYLWSPAAGLDNPALPNPVANPGSTTTYTVTGTDDNGCTSTQTLTVTVHPLPNLVAVAIDPVICLGNTTTLSSAGATNFVWEPASAILGPNNLSDVTANPTSTTVYTVTGTDANGCVQTRTVTVAVNFQPTVSAFAADDEICVGQSVNLSATGAINYQWEPAALLNNPGVFNPVATPSVTTTFTVTGTNAGGCVDTDEITVVVHPLPTISATATPGAICPGQTTSQLSASGGVSYAWLPTAGLSDPSSPNPVAAPAVTTTYTVTGTDANGCVATATTTVTVNVLPTLTATSSAPFVCLGQSATLTGAGAASYVWEPAGQITGPNAGISVTATPNATTVYTLTGADDNGCVSQRTLTLNVVPNPVVSLLADRLEICAGQSSAQLTAAGAASYAWQPVSGLNNPNIANPVANPAATTTYTVTGTTAQGCTDTETITITVHPLPTVSIATGPTTICFGDNTTLTASGAVTYRWEPTAGLSNANIANPTASPAATTTYTVFGTDANGCVSTASVVISVGQLPTVNAAASQPDICSGQTTTLTASGSSGASYIWQPTTGLLGGNAGASVQAAPQQTTVYTVTATTGLGCVNTTTVTVNVTPSPTVTVNPSIEPVCEGQSVTLLASGGVSYVWNPPTFLNNPNIPNPTASPLYNLTYTVTVTGANGCQSTAAVPVFVYPNPTVSANVTPANPTGTLTVFFITGAAPFDVLVQRAGSTQEWTRTDLTTGFTEFADMPAGAYLITVTDGNGCVGRTNAVINPPNCTLTVNAGTDITVCSGSVNTLNATVAGAPGPVTYLWEPNLNIDNPVAPSVTLIPSATTIYTVTVTSGVCFAQDAVAVNVIAEPALYAAPLQTHVCPGGGTVITATGAESYVWEPGGIIAPSITVTPPATTTYTVTGTTQGCSKSTTVTVNVYPAGNLTLNAFPNVACLGQTVQLQATGGTSYLWTPTAGLDDATSPTPLATPAQTTTYTVTATDANACPISNFITVTVNALPTAAPSASPAQICAGQTTTLTANASANAVSYEWQPASAIVGPNDQAVVTAQPGTTTTFTVRVRDAADCEGTATTTVAVSQLTTLNATVSPSPVCPGEPTTLFATGATAYQWSPVVGLSNPNVSNPVATLNETTTFTVTGTDPNGCSAQTTVTVSVLSAPALSVAPANTTLCLGDNAPLSVFGAASYSWSPITGLSDPNAANPVAAPTATTTYTVRGTDANGCVAQATVTITVVSPPAVSAVASSEAICAGQTTVLSVPGFSDALTYTWAPASAIQGTNVGPTVVGAPLNQTTYTVTARDANGCQSTATVAVNVSNVVNLTAYAVPSQVCAGDPVTLYATGATTYLWQPSSLVSQPAQPVVVANPTATTTFTVTGYDPQGCLGTAQVTVTVFNPINLTITASDATLCVGESAILTASGAVSYAWSPALAVSDPNSAQVSVTPSSTTTYTVVGTDGNGCSRSQTITITVVNPPTVTAGANASSVCPNATTTLFATGAASYVWAPQNAIDGTNVGANVTARPSQTTVYTVTGTDANGCSQTATVLVAVNPAPPVTLFVSDDFVCPGTEVQFSAAGASNYVWEPAGLFSSPFGTGQTLTIFEATTVVVYGTDANGCVNSASATVNVFTPPTATVAATQAPNATVTVAITGGLAPYTVRIVGFGVNATVTDVADATSFSGLNAGTYDVYVTDANGCRYTTFVSVFLPGCDLAVYAGEDRSVCLGTSSTLTAEITGGSGEIAVSWAPSSGLNTTAGASVVATPVSTTTYTVTAVSGICTAVDVVTIEVRPAPAVGAYTTTPAVCAGSAATLNALGADSYVWMPGNLVGATVVVFPTQTTIYTVTGTSLGCSSTATVTVNVHPLPAPVAETDRPAICLGESATLYASGGTSYQWAPTAGLSNPFVANPTATPSVTTVYTVTARNQFGCESTATVEIAVNPVPTAAIFGAGSALCYGQTAQITALAGPEYAYEWQPAAQISGANDGLAVVLAPTQTTTYTLTVRNAEGCSRTATYTQVVYPPSQVTAFAPLSAICVGQSAPLFASGATSYRWEPPAGLNNPFVFNPVASPTETTTYTVYGTDMNGCVTTDETTITVHPLPQVVIPSNATICLGQSVQLSVEGADVFVWQPVTGLSDPTIANPVASPSQTTTYTVSAINSVTGCRNTGVITVSVNGLPNVIASALPAGPVCPGQTVQLGANGANVYRWEPSSLVSNPEAANPTTNPTQTTTFTVTGRNTFTGCENTATVTVAVFNVPMSGVAAQGPDTLCPGERLVLTATASGATNMQWTGPNGFSATGFTVTIENVTPEAAGDYVARGVGAGGCLGAADTVRVNVFAVPGLPTIRADEPVCEGGTLRLFAESDGATAYYWTGPNNWYSTEQNPVIASVDTRNRGTYQCRAIVGRCTSIVRSLGVEIYPLPPTPWIASNSPVCEGDTLRLRATLSTGEYLWQRPDGTTYQGPEVVVANVTTDYRGEWTLIAYTGACSTQTQRTSINVQTPNTPNPKPIPTICEGQSVKIEMRPPIAAEGYRLYLNETDEGQIRFRESLTTQPLYETVTYYIEPVVAGCNIERVPLTITVDKIPVADLSALPDTARTLFVPNISTVQFRDLSQFADSVLWDFGDGRTSRERNPKYTYQNAGEFTVTLVAYSAGGCADTVYYGPYRVLDGNVVGIPDAFTPNADGLNEKFELYVAGYPTYCLKIFNRWGFMVFDNECAADRFWDGVDKFSNQPCPEGVYTYRFTARDAAGREVSFDGTVTVIR